MSEHTDKEREEGSQETAAEPITAATAESPDMEGDTAGKDVHQLAEELNKTKDQLLRKIAEFENFRRRTREEQSHLVQYGNESLILDLLPVLDDFNRSLDVGKEHTDSDAFFKGVEILRNKFLGILERRGLKPIDTTAEHFDETYHEALMQVPDTGKEPGTVIDEVEKGYMLNDKVIRHAKVTVAADE
jgi:molecular chaperone GrpE